MEITESVHNFFSIRACNFVLSPYTSICQFLNAGWPVMWRLPSLFKRISTSLSPASDVSVSQDGRLLHLRLDGEPERRYHGVWLRHNCRCSQCLPPPSNQNIVHHSQLVDLRITNAQLKDGKKLLLLLYKQNINQLWGKEDHCFRLIVLLNKRNSFLYF